MLFVDLRVSFRFLPVAGPAGQVWPPLHGTAGQGTLNWLLCYLS